MHFECLCKEHLSSLIPLMTSFQLVANGKYLQCFLSEVNQHMIIQQLCGTLRSSNPAERYLLWKVNAGSHHSIIQDTEILLLNQHVIAGIECGFVLV